MIPGILKNLATVVLLAASLMIDATVPAMAADYPYPGTVTVPTPHKFDTLLTRLGKAISDNGMGVVAQASASRGAASRGVMIAGNAVIEVFRNDYAVRMLEASVPAGIEAPLRIYVIENADKSTTIIYRRPSAVFAPYGNAKLDAMARELDPIFEKIVRDAAAK
jgi:uncharacterized protein (DUF302 family)